MMRIKNENKITTAKSNQLAMCYKLRIVQCIDAILKMAAHSHIVVTCVKPN